MVVCVGSDGVCELGAMEDVIWCYRSAEKHVQFQQATRGNYVFVVESRDCIQQKHLFQC